MTFDEIKKAAESLDSHEKLILAQIMLQMALREQEDKDSQNTPLSYDIDSIKQSLSKLRPAKLKALVNSIKTQFNFKGGISDENVDLIIKRLKKLNFLTVDENNRVEYL